MDSLPAPKVPIWQSSGHRRLVQFCPCNESVDSLHALHTQHFFALLRPWSCNESGDSLHRMGHFSDFCPDPCNESGDSLHRMGHFPDFCPDPCNESGDSLHRMGHFPDFCPDPCNESPDCVQADHVRCGRTQAATTHLTRFTHFASTTGAVPVFQNAMTSA
jgi:hypothetical protein